VIVAVGLPLLAVVALVGAVLLGTRRPPRFELRLADDGLRIDFAGWDVFWVLRRAVTVPVAQVQGVAVAPLSRIPREGRKLAGAGIPGTIRAGLWVARGARDLWDVRTAEQVLWIELRPEAPYRRFILEVDGPARRRAGPPSDTGAVCAAAERLNLTALP
jgi:hypothetical protein